jgi:hypothetical protein
MEAMKRDKRIAAAAGGAAFLLVLTTWLWARSSSAGVSGTEGFNLKCTKCGAEFSIRRSDLASYPRGSRGEGFQCRKCDEFAARIANHCPKCERWFVPPGGSDAAPRCPSCHPAPPPKPATRRDA